MKSILESYEHYLRHSLGYTPETVTKYIGNLFIIFRDLNITSLEELKEINKKWLAEIWHILQKKRSLVDATVMSYQTALKKFVKYCGDNDYLPADLYKQIELTKPTDVYLYGFSREEKEAIRSYLSIHLATDKERRDAALIYFLWATGVRISEALQLDVHGDGVIYTTPNTYSGSFHTSDGKMYVHVNGKGKKNRIIIVSKEAVSYLNLYLWNRKDRRKELFLNHSSAHETDRLKRVGAYVVINDVFKKAGIEKLKGIATHRLRHTAVEEWIKLNIPTKAIVAMLGHYDERSLEPYFRRMKELTDIFAEQGNTIGKVEVPNDIKKFEEILRQRYASF